MIASWISLPAIALLAAGTPRQTALLFGPHCHEARRRRLRQAGLALLALSFALVMVGDDRARHCVTWIGLAGLEALAVGAACSLLPAMRVWLDRRASAREPGTSERPAAAAVLATAAVARQKR